MTAVKNQGSCGSCWAFSATETIESREFLLAKNDLKTLAPQLLVSCENQKNGGKDMGCNGGLMENAFDWLSKSGNGMALETT